MYSRLFKGEISDAVCGHFDNFNDLLNAIQEKNFIQVTIEYYCIFWIQDIIILYDHNTYFLSSPVCQSCISNLYRKLTEHF
jgi:hypothetical protein